LHKEEKIKVARSDRSLNRYYTLTENGYNIIPSLDYNDYAEIGGSDVQELAIEFVRYALGKGWFVAIGKQGMRERKPDLVAFDYEKQESIAVEIESTDHITHSHPEQVKRHMLEIEPFSRMIIVVKKGEAEEKARELLNQIQDDERKKRIEIISF
jgi:hypothetical protein